MSENQLEYIAALVELHRGLARKGPGDRQFALDLLGRLPALPAQPRIADLGCGSGAGTLLLAEHYRSRVRAVDASPVFIEELKARAVEEGLAHLVEPVCADMAALDWPAESVDLLWSEGAAYLIGFECALRTWRPLLTAEGIAVVSEMNWFVESAPPAARDFWRAEYPGIGTEQQNSERARSAGLRVVFTERLPSIVWWQSYYDPLRERIRRMHATGAGLAVIRDLEQEMSLFERYGDYYGYTYYVLTPSAGDCR